MTSPATKPVWTVMSTALTMRPPLEPFPLIPVPVGEGEVPLRWMGQLGSSNLHHKTHVEVWEGVDKTEEELPVGSSLMLNSPEWVRTSIPVGPGRTKLIWKPLPMGQPVEGLGTRVELSAVWTFSFKMTLKFGDICCREQRTSSQMVGIVGQCESGLGRSTIETNRVSQGKREVGGITGAGNPSDVLSPHTSIPERVCGRHGDGCGQGGCGKEEGCREGGEGTHDFGWEGGGRRGEIEDEGGLFKVLSVPFVCADLVRSKTYRRP